MSDYKPKYRRDVRRLGHVAASIACKQRPGAGHLVSLGVPGSGLSDESMKYIATCVRDNQWQQLDDTEAEVRELRERALEQQQFHIRKRAKGRIVSIDSGLR
jgi:hypothetical protein